MLEVASRHTEHDDTGEKRGAYAAPGIPEYWYFDETGEFYGDRLGDGGYEPVETARLSEDILQGYSDVLNLHIRWHNGRLEWYDPETGRHIPTLDDERAARIRAEARNRELEEELRRLRGE